MRAEAEIQELLDAVKDMQRANLECPHCGAMELGEEESKSLYELENALCWILGVPLLSDHCPNPCPPEPAIFPAKFPMSRWTQRLLREACPDNALIQRELV